MDRTIDYAVIIMYLAGVTIFGMLAGGRQRSASDYFLGGKRMAWWAVGFSIVASETSTLTFISVPGIAYASNMHFLQVIFGYFLGRILVSLFFIPAYYRGNLETAYDFLGKRFGQSLRKFTSSVFIVTRVLASGVRLFATAIPVHFITGWNYHTCILVIGIFTLAYTYTGGLKAVVAMDVVQLFIYLGGAAVSMYIILSRLPNGWGDVMTVAGAGKFEIINPHLGNGIMEFLSSPYTLLGGVLGGTFLSMASHGTDQLLVQRLLGCSSKRDSQKALMLDASLIILQFLFFLVLGLCLYAFYGGAPLGRLGLSSPDEIFPKFIIENLPPGVMGFLIAGVLASAMGSLSSAISSLASSAYLDIFRPSSTVTNRGVFWPRLFTLVWGAVLICGAMLFTETKSPVVELGLRIQSITYGGLLGTFFLGLLFKRTDTIDAYAGFISALAAMVLVLAFTRIDFTWHTFIGCAVCIAVGNGSTAGRGSFLRYWRLSPRGRS